MAAASVCFWSVGEKDIDIAFWLRYFLIHGFFSDTYAGTIRYTVSAVWNVSSSAPSIFSKKKYIWEGNINWCLSCINYPVSMSVILCQSFKPNSWMKLPTKWSRHGVYDVWYFWYLIDLIFDISPDRCSMTVFMDILKYILSVWKSLIHHSISD